MKRSEQLLPCSINRSNQQALYHFLCNCLRYHVHLHLKESPQTLCTARWLDGWSSYHSAWPLLDDLIGIIDSSCLPASWLHIIPEAPGWSNTTFPWTQMPHRTPPPWSGWRQEWRAESFDHLQPHLQLHLELGIIWSRRLCHHAVGCFWKLHVCRLGTCFSSKKRGPHHTPPIYHQFRLVHQLGSIRLSHCTWDFSCRQVSGLRSLSILNFLKGELEIENEMPSTRSSSFSHILRFLRSTNR